MNSICNNTSCWILWVIVLFGIVGQATFIWWSQRRADKRLSDAMRQARKDQANLIENEFDKLKGSE